MDFFVYLWSTRKNYVVYCFVLIEKRKAKPSTKKIERKKTCMCPKPDARKKEKKGRKQSFQKKKKKRIRVAEFTLFMLKLHSHGLQLFVIPYLTLCLVAPLNSKSCASTKL